MLLAGRELEPEVLMRLKDLAGSRSRRQLAEDLCREGHWSSPNGRPALMSARKALAALTRKGHLPAPSRHLSLARRRCQAGEPELTPVVGTLDSIGTLEVIMVPGGRSTLSDEWNALMDRFHYLKAGPLCGAQLRYLVRCNGEPIAGLAFSAAAWQLRSRDAWIGWSNAARRENLHLVINNSRFLIAPHVEVANLASHLLGRVLRRIRNDWQERYGYMPVLAETFVEMRRFHGGSYRAANWQAIGVTQGRTRQDSSHACQAPRKVVWIYALTKDCRRVLQQLPQVRRLADLAPKSAPQTRQPVDWAEEEFGNASLADKRLVERCCTLARDFYARPNAQIPQACRSRAGAKAAWRFFDNPRVTMATVQSSHYQSTFRRMAGETVVLAVQDTTTLNYSTHPATEMLGPIGPKPGRLVGMLVHSTMAFNLSGTPLGLLHVQCWTREESEHGKAAERRQWPLESKESVRWLRSLQAVEGMRDQCPQTQIVSVGDCESDIYELFVEAAHNPGGVEVLVRAWRPRVLADGETALWPHVQAQPVAGVLELQLPRQPKRPARVAQVSVRFAQVVLRPPAGKSSMPSVRVWAVWAHEENAPDGVEAIDWMLLTTLAVSDFDSAVEKLTYYSLRWGIEVFHRVLKSGCKIETRQLAGADRLEACLAIDMVVAWRIYYLTKLGRQVPDIPCTAFFDEHEWKALSAYVTGNPTPPSQPPPLRNAIRMVASLGGFLGRQSDGEPGTKTLWLGLQRLDDLSSMYWILTTGSGRAPPVSSN